MHGIVGGGVGTAASARASVTVSAAAVGANVGWSDVTPQLWVSAHGAVGDVVGACVGGAVGMYRVGVGVRGTQSSSPFLMHGIVGGGVGAAASARASAKVPATVWAADERACESASTPASAAEPTPSATRIRDRLGRDVVVVGSGRRGAPSSMALGEIFPSRACSKWTVISCPLAHIRER